MCKWDGVKMSGFKYNFAIFGYDQELYKIPYADVINSDSAVYLSKPLDSKSRLLTVLYKSHITKKINKFVKLPFKGIWNPLMFRSKNKFKEIKPLCFVFFMRRCNLVNQGLIKYLRKKYPDAKFVCFYQDLVKKYTECSLERIKSEFDLVLSFDHVDAEEYGLYYYPLVYSVVDIPDNPQMEKSDVFFVGVAKNRLDDILDAYVRLRDAGLKCDFTICGVPEEQRRLTDEVKYSEKMPYTENLQHIKATRCLLEIMQKGGHGYTLRACEAIVLGRKLLTNNPEIENAPFYSPDTISTFTTADTINLDFVKSGNDSVDYSYKDKLSPIHLLEFIEEKLAADEKI